MAWRRLLPTHAPPIWRGLVLGAVLALVGLVLRLFLGPELAQELPFITFFPALVVASALGGMVGGVTCLAVASLAVWRFSIAPGAAPIWGMVAFWLAGGLIVIVAAGTADTVRRLRAVESDLNTTVRELAHRGRNALAVIMSIVSQSARSAGSAAEAEQLINARLQALARAQDLVIQGDGAAAPLAPLLERTLEPFDLARFSIDAAAPCHVEPEVAVSLGLLFHELATNAVKYGALSVPEGRVSVSWKLVGAAAELRWKELGGPPVEAPSRRGFGGRLIDAALATQGGGAERQFTPEGVVCELRIPLAATNRKARRLAVSSS